MHRRKAGLGAVAAALAACGGAHTAPTASPAPEADRTVPFEYVAGEAVRIQVTIGDTVRTHLMLDTGAGITVLSQRVCEQLRCEPDGTYVARRMSGQSIPVPMARVQSITIAGHRVANARVGVLDTRSLLPPELGVDGLAALDLFREQPFSIDHASRRVVIEDEASLRARHEAGSVATVRVEHDGPSTTLFLPMDIVPGTPALSLEVDSGSQSLILDERFMAPLGIEPGGAGVRRAEGRDATDHVFVRFFTTLPRAARVRGAEAVTVPAQSSVMFQHIIHDGLVGQAFLRAYVITFDVAHRAMIFARP